MSDTQRVIIVIRETFLQSVGADVFSWGTIALMLWANARYFGDHASIAVLFTLAGIGFGIARATTKKQTFRSRQGAIEFINDLK